MNPYTYVLNLKEAHMTGAQSAIEKALLTLYEEKEVYQISVKELTTKANVARSTFYTYYEVIDDCMQSLEDRCIYELLSLNEKLMSKEKIHEMELSFFKNTLQYMKENEKLYYLFLVKRPNNRFIEKWKDAIKYHMYDRMPVYESEKNKDLTLEMIASETIGAFRYWLKNPYEVDFSYVKKLIVRTIEAYGEQ